MNKPKMFFYKRRLGAPGLQTWGGSVLWVEVIIQIAQFFPFPILPISRLFLFSKLPRNMVPNPFRRSAHCRRGAGHTNPDNKTFVQIFGITFLLRV